MVEHIVDKSGVGRCSTKNKGLHQLRCVQQLCPGALFPRPIGSTQCHNTQCCDVLGQKVQTFLKKGNKGNWASVVQEAAEVGVVTQQQITVSSLAQGGFFMTCMCHNLTKDKSVPCDNCIYSKLCTAMNSNKHNNKPSNVFVVQDVKMKMLATLEVVRKGYAKQHTFLPAGYQFKYKDHGLNSASTKESCLNIIRMNTHEQKEQCVF